jgi:GNAT superfamily N-acetyltransferase
MAEVTTCADPGELAAALAPIFGYFGSRPDEGVGERFARVLPPERMHVAREDGLVVAGGGAFPFELTVPGGATVRAAGVTVVGVLPTHRRRGLLRSLMRAQLDDVHGRGEPVSYLWASDDEIYGRFGYGMASMTADIDVPREHGRLARPPREASLRLLSAEEALEQIPPLYDRLRLEHPGMFSRTRAWWEVRRLADPPERRGGGGELAHVLLEQDGEPAVTRSTGTRSRSWTASPTRRSSSVRRSRPTRQPRRSGATCSRSTGSLGSRPTCFRSTIRCSSWPRGPRYLRLKLHDGLWVRLVDVAAALSGRSYNGDGAVVFDVRDEFCPWNEGRWRLEGGRRSGRRRSAISRST